jgi:hypothetical protein
MAEILISKKLHYLSAVAMCFEKLKSTYEWNRWTSNS